jgi:hypothetical protein
MYKEKLKPAKKAAAEPQTSVPPRVRHAYEFVNDPNVPSPGPVTANAIVAAAVRAASAAVSADLSRVAGPGSITVDASATDPLAVAAAPRAPAAAALSHGTAVSSRGPVTVAAVAAASAGDPRAAAALPRAPATADLHWVTVAMPAAADLDAAPPLPRGTLEHGAVADAAQGDAAQAPPVAKKNKKGKTSEHNVKDFFKAYVYLCQTVEDLEHRVRNILPMLLRCRIQLEEVREYRDGEEIELLDTAL